MKFRKGDELTVSVRDDAQRKPLVFDGKAWKARCGCLYNAGDAYKSAMTVCWSAHESADLIKERRASGEDWIFVPELETHEGQITNADCIAEQIIAEGMFPGVGPVGR